MTEYRVVSWHVKKTNKLHLMSIDHFARKLKRLTFQLYLVFCFGTTFLSSIKGAFVESYSNLMTWERESTITYVTHNTFKVLDLWAIIFLFILFDVFYQNRIKDQWTPICTCLPKTKPCGREEKCEKCDLRFDKDTFGEALLRAQTKIITGE